MKYAVYAVLVEDTEEADISMGEDTPGEQVERIAGNLEYDVAKTLMKEVAQDGQNVDQGVAR